MKIAIVLGLMAPAALLLGRGEARAQAAPGLHFNRTSTGASGPSVATGPRVRARGATAFERTAATPRQEADLLAPYTSRPVGGTSVAAPEPPPPRTAPGPAARNYYPSTRAGQHPNPGRGHCTPSRAGVLGRNR